jgi:hypothetical protein
MIAIVLALVLFVSFASAATVNVKAASGSTIYINGVSKGKTPGNQCGGESILSVSGVPLNTNIKIKAYRLADNCPYFSLKGCKLGSIYTGEITIKLKSSGQTVKVPQSCKMFLNSENGPCSYCEAEASLGV